jgi:hypothetical protein
LEKGDDGGKKGVVLWDLITQLAFTVHIIDFLIQDVV